MGSGPVALSVVAPCFDEEGGLAALHRRVTAVCESCVGDAYEIVLVNDGSRAATWAIIGHVASREPSSTSTIS